jgi:hypothetical protein
MVVFSAIGKAGFFALMFIFWLLGEAPGRGVLAATGDLVLAGIFAWWLLWGTPAKVTASAGLREPLARTLKT